MAWNVRTWVPGLVTSAMMNEISGNFTALGGPVVKGIVLADGTVYTGTGFASVKNSTGNYTVTFTVAFSATPVIGVTTQPGAAAVFPNLLTSSSTAFTVQTFTSSSAAATDSIFHFSAWAE